MMIYPLPIMAKYYSLVPLPMGIFENLSLMDRAVFGLIWERYRLSSYKVAGGDETWYDADQREIYCVYAHDELARQIGTSEKTIRRSLISLRESGLIWWRKASYMGSCRFYVDHAVRAEMSALRQDSRSGEDCP